MSRRTRRFWQRNKHLVFAALTLGPGMFLACWGVSQLLWMSGG